MKTSSLLHGAVVCGFLSLGCAVFLPSARGYEALYVFGDSLDATSGGSYWQGRWSNGPMWPELLSTNLGFPYRPGNNRATGGANSSQILGQVRALGAPANAATALFVVDVGHQDFLGKTDELTFNTALRSAMINLSNSVVECYLKGGRAVALMSIWDPNRSPRLARLITDPVLMRERGQGINANMRSMADELVARYSDLRLWRIDMFALFDAMVIHSDHYGFTRTDLGALEDPQLTDKSYQGPGNQYMFWDSSHLTAKGHALVAQVFLAALRGSALRIDSQSDGFLLALDALQIGKIYHLQHSLDLGSWEQVDSFCALDPSRQQVVRPASARGFYRLDCPDTGSVQK